MTTRDEIIRRLLDPGIVAIVRAPDAEQVLPVTEALLAGGVTAVEITLTTSGAIAAIVALTQRFGAEVLAGVGTVLDPRSCVEALTAGAQFVVSPICRPDLVAVAHREDRPIMLGACTPTEAQTAHEAGADFVKLFPADNLGPSFVKALRAPLPHLRIVPTGGVDLNTAAAFLQAGCVALGVGSSLVSARILRERDWRELTRLARAFVDAARSARQGFGA